MDIGEKGMVSDFQPSHTATGFPQGFEAMGPVVGYFVIKQRISSHQLLQRELFIMRRLWLYGMVLAAVTWLAACSDKAEGLSPDNSINLYGNVFGLSSGVIWQNNPNMVLKSVPYVFLDSHDGVTDTVKGYTVGTEQYQTGNFMLSLYEDGLSYNPSMEKAQGRGSSVCFHMASPSVTELKEGTYKFGDDKSPFTFTGFCSSDYNTMSTSNIAAALTEGEVTLEKLSAEGNYRVKFQCKTGFGAEVKGTYTGRLDQCRVSQVNFTQFDNVHLAGLMDSIHVTSWYNEKFVKYLINTIARGYPEEYGYIRKLPTEEAAAVIGYTKEGDKYIDYANSGYDLDLGYHGKAFLSLATGLAQNAAAVRRNPESADIALRWSDAEGAFHFMSPIKSRPMLKRNGKYDFPCHTTYMNVPQGFSESDYQNFKVEDLNFEMKDEDVVIPMANFRPTYLYFQTGKGVKGIIKVKSYTEKGEQTDFDIYSNGYIDVTLNPALQIELKCPAVVANPQIR